jgi:hypothetical protein
MGVELERRERTEHQADDILSFLVARDDLKQWSWRRSAKSSADVLASDEALIKISKFALTANNLTYAKFGDSTGFWRFFPAPSPWGQIPVWGIGQIEMSRSPSLGEGERVYGFFPMASHLFVLPGQARRRSFIDGRPHRAALPRTYNEYGLIDRPDRESLTDHELVLRPLFALSFFLWEYLFEANMFSAATVLISSASSKTALGLAFLLAQKKERNSRVVGLTSARNAAFVGRSGKYDDVVPYNAIDTLARHDAIFIDIAGDDTVLRAVHRRFGDRLKRSILVGATHRYKYSAGDDALNSSTERFFTPDHIIARRQQWGAAVLRERQGAAMRSLISDAQDWLRLEYGVGKQALEAAYQAVVEGRVPPDIAHVLSLSAL